MNAFCGAALALDFLDRWPSPPFLARATTWPVAVATAGVCVAAAAAFEMAIRAVANVDLALAPFYSALLLAMVWAGWRAGVIALALSVIIEVAGIPTIDASLAARAAPALALIVFGALLVLAIARLERAWRLQIAAEHRSATVAAEMAHRVGNAFALAQVLARQSARGVSTAEELLGIYEQRLIALSRAQHIVKGHADERPPLNDLVHETIAPFGASRFAITPLDWRVPADCASMLGLLLYELCTNAAKYGALSVEDGRVAIDCRRVGAMVELRWTEAGGPPPRATRRDGFGARLARTALPPDRGRVDIDYAPEGLRCLIAMAADAAKG